jgi:hypothetical protein
MCEFCIFVNRSEISGCVNFLFFLMQTDTIHPLTRVNRQTETDETDILIWAEMGYDIQTVG